MDPIKLQQIINKKPKDVVTADEWNEILTLLIEQANLFSDRLQGFQTTLKQLIDGKLENVDITANVNSFGGRPPEDYTLDEELTEAINTLTNYIDTALKNKVNKSITGIDENGLIVKSIIHLQDYYINKLITNSFIVEENAFLNYEIKQYNHDSFNSFISKFQNFYRNYYDEVTSDLINNSFDVNNFINFKLFVCLISGNDNLTYNQYLSLKNPDSKILITPWDMDLTWGLKWQEDYNLHSAFSTDSIADINWIDENITKNMDEDALSLMKQRYWELRKDVITVDTINSYLDSYKELLVNSGAAKRDSERWYEYDVEFEIEQIREWARRRIEFLDEYFK